jgi:hypothetical protein
MYTTIKDHVVKEHTHEVALEKKALVAKRRVKLTGCFGIVMSLFLGLSVTFNYMVVFGVVDSQMRTTTDGVTCSTAPSAARVVDQRARLGPATGANVQRDERCGVSLCLLCVACWHRARGAEM